MDITVGNDFLGPCDQKSSYKHVFLLNSYGVMAAWNLVLLKTNGTK